MEWNAETIGVVAAVVTSIVAAVKAWQSSRVDLQKVAADQVKELLESSNERWRNERADHEECIARIAEVERHHSECRADLEATQRESTAQALEIADLRARVAEQRQASERHDSLIEELKGQLAEYGHRVEELSGARLASPGQLPDLEG